MEKSGTIENARPLDKKTETGSCKRHLEDEKEAQQAKRPHLDTPKTSNYSYVTNEDNLKHNQSKASNRDDEKDVKKPNTASAHASNSRGQGEKPNKGSRQLPPQIAAILREYQEPNCSERRTIPLFAQMVFFKSKAKCP